MTIFYAIGKITISLLGNGVWRRPTGEEFAPIERPESYYDENYGYVYPQEEIEDTVRSILTYGRIHEDSYVLSAGKEGYAFPAGPGFGIDTEPIVTGVEQQNDLLFYHL